MTIKKSAKAYSDESLAFLGGLMGKKQTLGSLLLAVRKGEELTQEEFARILKIPKQNLSDIENNRRPVSPSKAVVFAKKLGYSPIGFVRLALQDLLEREGIRGVTVNIEKQAG